MNNKNENNTNHIILDIEKNLNEYICIKCNTIYIYNDNDNEDKIIICKKCNNIFYNKIKSYCIIQ
jgi:DNA-directed RNA polymerase subunit RPC12/RpoP